MVGRTWVAAASRMPRSTAHGHAGPRSRASRYPQPTKASSSNAASDSVRSCPAEWNCKGSSTLTSAAAIPTDSLQRRPAITNASHAVTMLSTTCTTSVAVSLSSDTANTPARKSGYPGVREHRLGVGRRHREAVLLEQRLRRLDVGDGVLRRRHFGMLGADVEHPAEPREQTEPRMAARAHRRERRDGHQFIEVRLSQRGQGSPKRYPPKATWARDPSVIGRVGDGAASNLATPRGCSSAR